MKKKRLQPINHLAHTNDICRFNVACIKLGFNFNQPTWSSITTKGSLRQKSTHRPTLIRALLNGDFGMGASGIDVNLE